MPITRDFRITVYERAARDAKFRRAMLLGAVNNFLEGDIEICKAFLRDYINATVTFKGMAEKIGKSDKSLHRMLSPKGNPTFENIAAILKILQEHEHVKLHATLRNAA